MTPKEKAQELLDKFLNSNRGHFYQIGEIEDLEAAKECALIAVDEMIKVNPHINPFNTDVYSTMDYWKEVRQEIEKL